MAALLAAVIANAALAVIAHVLAGRRDVGMSFLPPRPGPAQGRVSSAHGPAWRLQRGSLSGWTVGFLPAGTVFGILTNSAADLVGDNEGTREIFERMDGQTGLTDAFLASTVGALGMVAALTAGGLAALTAAGHHRRQGPATVTWRKPHRLGKGAVRSAAGGGPADWRP